MAFNTTGGAIGAGVGFGFGGPVGAGAGALIGGYGGDIAGGKNIPIIGGLPGIGSDPLGDFFGGGQKIGTPDKKDFQYGGQGEAFFQNAGQQLYNRPAVQADLTNANQSRGLGMQSRSGIQGQINNLQALIKDPKQSVAYQQMQEGANANMQQALALARANGGTGAAQGSALRQAQAGNAIAGQQLNQAAGVMRAGETTAANQQISGLMLQQRAMDLQAQGLDAQTAFQQAQLELGSQQLGQQGLLAMYGLGQGAASEQLKGSSDYWKTLLGAQAAQAQADAQQKAGIMGMIGGIGGGIISAGGIPSDIRGKQDIVPLSGLNGPAFQNAGMPAISTGGAMGSPELQSPGMTQDWYKTQERNKLAGDIFKTALQQPVGTIQYQDADQYLPSFGIPSDSRAKESAYQLGARHALDAVRPMFDRVMGQHPGATLASGVLGGPVGAVASRATQEIDAHKAYEDALAQAFADQSAAAADQRRYEAAQAAPQAPPAVWRPVPSDARAKREAFKLGVATGAGMPGPLGGPSWDTFHAVDQELGYGRPHATRYLGGQPTAPEYPPMRGVAPGSVGRMPDLHPVEAEASQVPAYRFRYKQPFASQYGAEPRIGAMAQDLEQNPLYAPAVKTRPDGLKVVDAGQATMANVAALSDVSRHAQELEDRLRRLEAMGGMVKPKVR